MTTVNSSKMKDDEIAALQSEIDFYRNLIAQHNELVKSKNQPAAGNCGSLNDVHALCNTKGKVLFPTNSKISQSNCSNQQAAKILSKDLKLQQSSSGVPNGTISKRTVILNKMKNPVHKAPNLISKKLPVKPIAIKSTLTWKSNKYKKDDVLYKKTNGPTGNNLHSSNVPKLQCLESSLKDSISTPCLNVKINNSSKLVAKNDVCLQSKMKAPFKKNSKSHSEILCEEIKAITEQLKQASKTLSLKNAKNVKPNDTFCDNVKLNSKSIGSLSSDKSYEAKNIFSSVLVPKSSLSLSVHALSSRKLVTSACNKQTNGIKFACTLKTTNSPLCSISKDPEFIPLQSISAKQNMKNLNCLDSKLLLLQKATGNKPEICIKPIKRLQNAQMIPTPMKVVKTPVSVKRKVTTRLISSKFKVVNKKSPCLHTATSGIVSLQKNFSTARELQFKSSQWAHQREMEGRSFKARTRLLNSKYKVVNKNHLAGNLKSNLSELSSPKSLKVVQNIVSKKRKSTFECMNNIKKLKTSDRFTFVSKSNPMTSKRQFSSKLDPKISEVKNCKAHTPLKRSKIHSLNSLSKSKYKVINKMPNHSWSKASKGLKSSSNKLFNFSTDVDLLMELAAENNSHSNSTPKLRDRSVLLKRVYKSKNTIINKNVSSAQVKTAKMIKSKYLSSHKKHLWHKQAKSRHFSNFRHFQGGHKNFQTKFYSTSFCNHRNKRNHSKHKISNYANYSYYSRSARKMQYPQNKFAFGTFKSFKRISGNRTVFTKTNVRKPSTPVSKTLASRVLQHSINRVLTASVKKKMSKVNTYCMFYNRFGRCNNGTKCAYIHDPSKIAICTRFLRGTCKAENCLFSHEICPGKMAICSFFLSGSCTKINCPYRHEMLPPGAELCKAFVQGYCSKGKQCKKAHILVCPDYVKGFCSKGDACAFPHPPPKEKKMIEKTAEKCENLDTDEFLMERVSRYFQPSNEETSGNQNLASNDSVVPKRKNLPEQPSFISLFRDCDS